MIFQQKYLQKLYLCGSSLVLTKTDVIYTRQGYLEAPRAPTLIEPVADRATKVGITQAAGPNVRRANV